jgi:hypothetical protein
MINDARTDADFVRTTSDARTLSRLRGREVPLHPWRKLTWSRPMHRRVQGNLVEKHTGEKGQNMLGRHSANS